MELKEIANLSPEEAVKALGDFLTSSPDNDEALTMRGLRNWALGRKKEAINDWLAAVDANPASKARTALENAGDILGFFNKDLYNP